MKNKNNLIKIKLLLVLYLWIGSRMAFSQVSYKEKWFRNDTTILSKEHLDSLEVLIRIVEKEKNIENVLTIVDYLKTKRSKLLALIPIFPPVDGQISSSFGMRFHPIYHCFRKHLAIDYACKKNQVVRVTADGRVKKIAYDQNGLGNYIIIEHGFYIQTYYAHLSAVTVDEGEILDKGEPIGFAGSTGLSTGVHLHYGIKIYEQFINPKEIQLYP